MRTLVNVHGEIVESGRSSNWRDMVATFVAEQDVRESSRLLYTRTLSQFFVWVEKTNRSLPNLSRVDILLYKDYLLEKKLSNLTVGSYLTAVRKFFSWCESKMLYPDVSKGVKCPKRKQAFKKQHLSERKITELLEYFKKKSIRDYAIVNLLLRCGLRTIELTRADVRDICFRGERRVLLVMGKGHDERDDFVILTEKAYRPIADYLATRKGVKGSDPLFVSESKQNKGGRLTTRTISAICKEGLVAIGLDGREFSAHSLRHTAAVQLLKHGCQLTDVQSVLRHTNPATSQIYIESIKTEMRLLNAPETVLDDVF